MNETDQMAGTEKPERSFALYLRQDGEVSGPYPRGLLERYLELGRIRPDDELSADGVEWQTAEMHLPGISALEQLLRTHSAQEDSDERNWAHERHRARLRWINERDSEDRRRAQGTSALENQRSGRDRREVPLPVDGRPHFIPAGPEERPWVHTCGVSIVAILILAILGVGVCLWMFVPRFVPHIRLLGG